MPERPSDFIDEDHLLIVEALASWAGPPMEAETKRQVRAYQLIEAIALEMDCSLEELRDKMQSVNHSLLPPKDKFDARVSEGNNSVTTL